MNPAELVQLSSLLHNRSYAVATRWHEAIASASFVPLSSDQVRQRLTELTTQFITCLLAEPFDPQPAQAIGESLVQLRYVQPEALRRTQQVLGTMLEGLPADQIALLYPRLVGMLGELTAGFSARVNATILAEQEQLRQALAVEQRRVSETISRLNVDLDRRVAERTAQLEIANQELLKEIAERERVQVSLQETSRTLQALIDASPLAIVSVDLVGQVKVWNPAAERLFGWSAAEVLGRRVPYVPNESRAEARALYDIVRRGKDYIGAEVQRSKKDGTLVDVHVSSTALYDAQGDLSGFMSVLADITLRKQAEEALLRSERHFRALIENASDIILMLDEAGVIRYTSPSVQRMLGYAPEERIGKDCFAFVHPDDVIRAQTAFAEIVQTHGLFRPVEMRIQHRDGSWHVFDGVVNNLLADPTVQAIVINARDITERKQAEEVLRQGNRDLTLFNQASQTLTATLDLHDVTERLMRLITETIGTRGASVWLLDNEEKGSLVCRAAYPDPECCQTGVRLPIEYSLVGWVARTGQGAVAPDVSKDDRFSTSGDARTGFQIESLLAVPLRLRDRVIGVLDTVNKLNGDFDEHDRVVLETLASAAAVAIENARLVEELRQRTANLRARNEELDAYSHTVAHDLKNPLHLMLGYAEALEEGDAAVSSEDRQHVVRSMIRIGNKMNSIIDALLLLAGVRNARVELQVLDMASIVTAVRQRLARLIWESNAQVTAPDEWLPALGYAPWVEEVWLNYLSNALKYGGPTPRIELGSTLVAGQIRFWVRDYGQGIAAQDQARLFTPFTQLTRVQATGYGLGLSIVRRIVEKLGGQVGVESDGVPGHGSLFYFTLPSLG
jgi:PAS domain S-box-containing protein